MDLTRKTVIGVAWTILTGTGTRALGLIGTLLLVRYLLPAEYGEVSAASVLVLTAAQMSTLGVGMYVVTHRDAGRPALFHATLLHVGLGTVAFGLVLLLQDRLAPLFDAPMLVRFVPGLVLAAWLDRVCFMPERVLVRDMRYQAVSLVRSAGELAYTGVSLWTAMRGHGGMSVVLGNIARSGVRAGLLFLLTPTGEWLTFGPIRWDILKDIAQKGLIIAVGAMAMFAARRWDNLVVSHYFGPAVLGLYNLAYNLADVPVVQVGEQITDVLMVSLVHAEPEKRAQALLRALGLLTLLMCPLGVGFGAVAPSVAKVFFQKSWEGVGTMLMLLVGLSIFRPIGGALSAYLQAHRRQTTIMKVEWISVAVLLGAMCTLGRPGPRWACVAVGVAFGVKALIYMWIVHKEDGLPMLGMLWKLGPPLLSCGPMLGAVYLVRHALGDRPALSLLCECLAGAAAYVAMALLLAREVSQDFLKLVRQALRGRRK